MTDSNQNENRSYNDTNVDYTREVVGYIKLVWKKRLLLIGIFIGLFIVTSGITLLLKNYYTAQAIVLPSGDNNKMTSLLSSLSGGVSISGGTENMSTYTSLYPLIGKSRTILKSVLKSEYNGKTVDEIIFGEGSEKSSEERTITLGKKINIVVNTKLGFVTVSGTDFDPEFATFLTNTTLDQIDTFFREKIRTSSGNRLELIETRLKQVSDSLVVSENALKNFREKNRIISNSPNLLMEQGRLEREIQIGNMLMTELIKQRELAVIDNMRDKPVINKLSYADVPDKKAGPRRSRIVLGIVFLGMILTLAYLFALQKNWFKRVEETFKAY